MIKQSRKSSAAPSELFEQEVIIDIVFPGNTGNRGSWFQSQFNHLKF